MNLSGFNEKHLKNIQMAPSPLLQLVIFITVRIKKPGHKGRVYQGLLTQVSSIYLAFLRARRFFFLGLFSFLSAAATPLA